MVAHMTVKITLASDQLKGLPAPVSVNLSEQVELIQKY